MGYDALLVDLRSNFIVCNNDWSVVPEWIRGYFLRRYRRVAIKKFFSDWED